MRISAISYSTKPYFTSKVAKIYNGQLPTGLDDKIDEFEETHDNAQKLGSGLFASAYLFNGTNYVIKESLPDEYSIRQNQDFFPESKALNLLPKDFKNSQQLVAHVQTEKDNYYLISTFVNGKARKYPEYPWNKTSFTELFKTLYTLDSYKIYHNDVNQSNCLVDDKNEVNMIDYQFAMEFSPFDSKNKDFFKTPKFMMPANAQMFEMASLPWYLRSMNKTAPKSEVRNTFKTYLDAKSMYARRRAMYLISTGFSENTDAIEYEMLQSKYFKNPSDDIINLEAKKLQLMYSYRKTFSLTDPNSKPDKNVVLALPSYIATATAAKDLILQAKQMQNKTSDKNLKKFLDYEIKFGEFWRKTMLEELGTNSYGRTWSWIDRNVKLNPKHLTKRDLTLNCDEYIDVEIDLPETDPLDDISGRIDASEKYPFASIKNIAGMITENNEHKKIYNINKDTRPEVQNKNNAIKDLSKQLFKQINELPTSVFSFNKDKYYLEDKYREYGLKGLKACNRQCYNTAIPNLMMAQYYASKLEKSKAQDKNKPIQDTTCADLAKQCGMLMEYYIKSDIPEKTLENTNDFEKFEL
jgi:hypothetical protein